MTSAPAASIEARRRSRRTSGRPGVLAIQTRVGDPQLWRHTPSRRTLFTKRGTKMSVESTALSRSKLEQKDRAELATIVEAMGGKAGSRAKKAELVDQVLQLAGAGESNRQDEPSPSALVDRVIAPPVTVEEPAAEWELAVAAEPPAATPREAVPPEAPEPAAAPEPPAAAEPPAAGSSSPPRPEPAHDQGDRGQGGSRDGGLQGQRDDNEPGNRRRP